MSNRFTRRTFMVTAGATATTVLGSSLFNLESVWAAPVHAPQSWRHAATDPVLVSYRKAIKAMKALPTSNPLSWNYQAAIHRTTLSGLTSRLEHLPARDTLLLVLASHVSLLV